MVKSRLLYTILSLVMVLVLAGGFIASQTAVFAQDASPTPTPVAAQSLTLESKYPVLTNDSGQSYAFSVDIKYAGTDKKTFDLSSSAPQGWTVTVTAGYPEAQVSAVQIKPTDPSTPSTESVKVNLSPNFGRYPQPGDYIVTLKVSSGTLTQSIDLKATVKARYAMALSTDTGNLTTKATAGKENHFSFNLTNTGSAAVEKINFTATKPDGWVVNFKPDKVDSLSSGQKTQVDVVINPPEGKTIAGDYMVSIKGDNGTVTTSSMDVRVMVESSSILGWVGIIIVVVVIAGLAVLFMRLGRR
jgi:uncharacterized membrane protein